METWSPKFKIYLVTNAEKNVKFVKAEIAECVYMKNVIEDVSKYEISVLQFL